MRVSGVIRRLDGVDVRRRGLGSLLGRVLRSRLDDLRRVTVLRGSRTLHDAQERIRHGLTLGGVGDACDARPHGRDQGLRGRRVHRPAVLCGLFLVHLLSGDDVCFLFLSRGLVLGSGFLGGLFSGCGLGDLVGLALDLRADGLKRLVQRILLLFLCGFLLFRCLRLERRDHCVSDGLGQRVGIDSRSAGRLVLRVLF